MIKNIVCLIVLFVFIFGFGQESKQPIPVFDFLSKYSSSRDFTISKNQDEVYFTIQSLDEQVSRIVFVKKEKRNWSKPKFVSFTSNHRDIEPFLSANGLRLYFASNRPLQDTINESKDYDIWYVERINLKTEWSKPINIGFPVNTSNDEFYPSVAANGNIYFTSDAHITLGKDDIFFSKWIDNKYTSPENLGTTINSEGYEFNAFISEDESFLIFTGYGKPDGLGSGDLYISYKDNGGNWETPKNLGNIINSKTMEYCPFYDTQTQTLYFTSKRNTVTNKKFNSIEDFESEINKLENGLSRIYKYQIKL